MKKLIVLIVCIAGLIYSGRKLYTWFLNNIKSNKLITTVNDNTDEILFCDAIVIPEARYENKIVSKVDYMLEKSKPILIFPNSIFNKNGYFSNYLIKQGADIILNKYDLLFILKPLSC